MEQEQDVLKACLEEKDRAREQENRLCRVLSMLVQTEEKQWLIIKSQLW